MAGSLAGWVFDKQADHPPGVGSGGQGGGECRGFGLCELSKAPSVTHSPGLPCPRPQPLFLPTAPLLAPGPRVEPISREPRASALPSHSGVVLTKRKGASLQAGTQMPPGPSSCGGSGGGTGSAPTGQGVPPAARGARVHRPSCRLVGVSPHVPSFQDGRCQGDGVGVHQKSKISTAAMTAQKRPCRLQTQAGSGGSPPWRALGAGPVGPQGGSHFWGSVSIPCRSSTSL